MNEAMPKKEFKGVIASAKLPISLIVKLDADAERDGTSRSHIMRRILLLFYAAEPKALEAVH